MIKTSNWLSLGQKWVNLKSICLQKKWRRKKINTILHLEIFHTEKKGNMTWCLEVIYFSFQKKKKKKKLFVVKQRVKITLDFIFSSAV